ncbi:hypothetical protein HanRHA438_Chr13g0614011 [Helianthus annuus]|uniref:Uncharacterized protein n=1 Tax=Helianthus annuus TaxID=4232 RepID=A0A9K3EK79_HELAN|nr:hypothetical protein HanXRQr2_Chr13g0603481 [Helianthus annuus]KAJ0477984.1 hypothetical protein HanHA300_Chr13g0495061 [Helianthus annuus]KAJ0482598.1 hypothetical protein HanIR_Chr13g0655731 [Helianthus annuus]KAJ0498837.1 hypothetical protein HanHA89_Chr13g0527471 [Helianthus annuus]KAJ0664856.1 hypothetical protein HanLR1_Chr13g0497541 [Helianthus annuus]
MAVAVAGGVGVAMAVTNGVGSGGGGMWETVFVVLIPVVSDCGGNELKVVVSFWWWVADGDVGWCWQLGERGDREKGEKN